MITSIITDIASGLGALVPAFFKALLDGFTSLFIDSSAEVVKLTPVGDVAILFIVIGMVYRIMPTVVGWLRLRASRRKKRARKSA